MTSLRTQRLGITPAVADDVDATWAFRRLPAVHRWLGTSPAEEPAYRVHFLAPERLSRTLIARYGDVVVGDLMLRVGDGWGQGEMMAQARGTQAELGWSFDPAWQGRGLATEAVAELVRHCFEDLGLRRVTAECFAANTASWRLMDRVGMRREAHTVADSLHRSGEWIDGYSYALLASEWRGHHTPRDVH